MELHSVDPSDDDAIYKVRNGKSVIPDFNDEPGAGCGVLRLGMSAQWWG
jgi:hypothetical protein